MEVTRLFDLLDNYIDKYPDQEAALAAKRNGQWRKYSINEYIRITNDISYGMIKAVVQPGDKISIVS